VISELLVALDMDPTTLQIAPRVAAVGLLGVPLAAPMALVSSWRRGYLLGLVALMAVVSLPSALAAGSPMQRQRCGWAWPVPQFGFGTIAELHPYFANSEACALNAQTSPASPKAWTFDTKREALAWYGGRVALPSRVDPRAGGNGPSPAPGLAGRAGTLGPGHDVRAGRCAPPVYSDRAGRGQDRGGD
jgi:hypothetical protein